jgi:hypothetical protein
MLVNHSCIKQVKDKPVVLKWIKDAGTLDSTLFKTGGDDTKERSSTNGNASDGYDAYDTKKSHDNQHNSPGSLNKNSECMSVATSYTSYASYSKQKVEDFFHDNPSLSYKPLSQHSLEQSPCYPIIGINHKRHTYYCKLHRKESENIHLESIEHHCKYKEPELHKNKIMQLIHKDKKPLVTETEENSKIIAEFIQQNNLNDAIDKLLSGIG